MKCFKCEEDMGCAVTDGDPWEMPCDGVQFEGGFNFGSSLYDAMMDGIYVEVVICDDCLKAAQGTDRIREMKKVHTPTKSIPI